MTDLADRLQDTPADVEQRVTPLELFFDLVFVFALTQVTGYVAHARLDAARRGPGDPRGVWWAWESLRLAGQHRRLRRGPVRVVLLAAMGAMLITSLAVPHAFGDDALIFGVAYLVRMLHIGAYMLVSRGDPVLRAVVLRLARRSFRRG